jgi:Fe-only nitrogenase accessory protein AnfO
MISQIAVMHTYDGVTTTLTDPGIITIYSKDSSYWIPVRTMPFSLDQNQGMVQIRKEARRLVSFLGDCKIFVAKATKGIVFYELEKAHFDVWEISGKPHEFLDQVWDEEEKDILQQSKKTDIPSPVEISPGQYYLSLIEMQTIRPDVSSKQILLKFIQTGAYQKLEVVCSHVPPWIAHESKSGCFSMQAENSGPEEVRLVLTKGM